MTTFTETPPGSGLYELTPGPDTTTNLGLPRVGPTPMILHRTADAQQATVTPAIRPDPAHLKIRPGRAIRVGISHNTLGVIWRFRGFIDSIEPVDDPEDWSTVTLHCKDALGEVGRAKDALDIAESGDGEEARTRFGRILNRYMWPATKRLISVSAIRALFAAALNGQAVDLLRQTAESEGGWCYGDNQGRVVLQGRDWLYYTIGAPVDATIGNVGFDDVCPGKWTRSFDRADIATRVIFDVDYPEDEPELPPIQLDDPEAQVLYGIEPYERTDLWTQNRDQLRQNAGRVLANRAAKVSMPRIRTVALDASTSDAALDLMTTASAYTPSRYRCRLKTDRGVVFDNEFFVVGITETITAESWTADIALDRARPYEKLDPVDFIWDTARWDRSLWN